MLEFCTNIPEYSMDLLDEVKLFLFPAQSGDVITHTLLTHGSKAVNRIIINDSEYLFSADTAADDKKILKRNAKHSLYSALKKHFNISPPWGSLTGVRPSKLAYEYLSAGGDISGISKHLTQTFDVTPGRADLVQRIVELQKECIGNEVLKDKVNLYIHVPFCNSRCNYCSFPSAVVKNADSRLSLYTDKLIDEIRGTLELIGRQNKSVYSVYIGGGTPTVLNAADIKRLLETVSGIGVEKTFEAGRPDSINPEKLDTIKEAGVGRICINPQSLNCGTLERIGRAHTEEQFEQAYLAAKARGFDINTDIIAGLDGESFSDFDYSLRRLMRLAPDNITVHTLSRKRASGNADKQLFCGDIDGMTARAASLLPDAGYRPYYLYKQKYTVGNFENVGYSKPGKECVNNITVMEEMLSVYACGAGAISKKIGGDGNISRFQNAKDIKLYTDEFDIRTAKKHKFLSN